MSEQTMIEAKAEQLPKGPEGWGLPNETLDEKLLFERRAFEAQFNDYPTVYRFQEAPIIDPVREATYQAWLETKGFEKGSTDISMISEYVLETVLDFFQQDTGSCVWTNTMQVIVDRFLFEIGVRGDKEEYFGLKTFGINSIAPFMISYGWARQRANMRSGDGLYCKPMVDSMTKDGFLMCSNPRLQELMRAEGITDPESQSYPEPRSVGLYRKIQNWAWNEALRPFGDFPLDESVNNPDVDTFIKSLRQYKGVMQCSMIAIMERGKSPDGFPIHVRNPRDQWAHNMVFCGLRVDKRGNLYARLSNRSWARRQANVDMRALRQAYTYNIPIEEVSSWIRGGRTDMATLGNFRQPASPALTV